MTEARHLGHDATSPIGCVAITLAKPGHEEDVFAALTALIAPTHKETGFRRYDLHRDVTEPRRFVFIEEWDDRPSFDAHCAAPHIDSYLAKTANWIEWSAFYPLKAVEPVVAPASWEGRPADIT